jgi:hypothetical protein
MQLNFGYPIKLHMKLGITFCYFLNSTCISYPDLTQQYGN